MQQDNLANYTPMMQQYLKIKEDYADAIVFFRLGDFYEMFFDDAIIASKVLEIALTSRDAGSKIPMAGVPHHSVGPYIQKLIEKGYKIAMVEQTEVEDRKLAKREVVRVITPGTVFEENILSANSNNYLASLLFNELGYMLTYMDISTGEGYVVDSLLKKDVYDQIELLNIKDIIISRSFDDEMIQKLKDENILITTYPNFSNYDGVLFSSLDANQKKGAKHLLAYVEATQKINLKHLKPFEIESIKHYMKADLKVKNHLEILTSLTNNEKTTLLGVLDHTKTSMGARLLKHLLQKPLIDKDMIEERLNYIESFYNWHSRFEVIEHLDYIYDINRIVGRVSFQTASPRDLVQLKDTLKQVPLIIEILNKSDNKLLTELAAKLDPHERLVEVLEGAIVDLPPITLKDGGVIKEGYNKNLDELRLLDENSQQWLIDFEEEERERTGIRNLKVGYNRVFGFFIEVSKGNVELVKDEFGYERRQTLTNSERYISPVLKEKEKQILTAKEDALKLEYELFANLREQVSNFIFTLQTLATNISYIDVYTNLAEVAIKNRYVRPRFNEEETVEVIKGRHPVVEKFTTFIENNVIMDKGEMFIITGPNMSGKSTYMRMYAIIVYMAQVGSFVPAEMASLPIYDAIYTRIGSSDDISGGKSTFMVEMVESNEALLNATDKSLILFDEIGRGTATYDGMALAQGMIEFIHEDIKAQTFFSTHYHELTVLEESLVRVKNLHVEAILEDNKMVFLHTVKDGATNKSYGLQVASLANLPTKLIKRSTQILKTLEQEKTKAPLDLFNYQIIEEKSELIQSLSLEEEKVLDQISSINTDNMTPIDALNMIYHLKKLLKKKDE